MNPLSMPLRTRLLLPLLLASLCPSLAAASARPDPHVGVLLEQLGYDYEVDEDGDYKLVVPVDGEGRTQLVYVRSPVETFGHHRIREIWSPAYASPSGAFPGPVANRLLEASNDLKLGAWVKQGPHAVFVVKIDARAAAAELDEAISAAVSSADGMEQELAGDPASDEY